MTEKVLEGPPRVNVNFCNLLTVYKFVDLTSFNDRLNRSNDFFNCLLNIRYFNCSF